MKTRLEVVIERVNHALKYLDQSFTSEEIEKDPRLSLLRGCIWMSRIYPEANEESDLRYQIDKAVADAEPNIELDLLDSNWDDVLIARMNGTYKASDTEHPNISNPKEAKSLLESRLEMYRDKVIQIENALIFSGGTR